MLAIPDVSRRNAVEGSAEPPAKQIITVKHRTRTCKRMGQPILTVVHIHIHAVINKVAFGIVNRRYRSDSGILIDAVGGVIRYDRIIGYTESIIHRIIRIVYTPADIILKQLNPPQADCSCEG